MKEKEYKIALVMDNYKIPLKDELWKEALKKVPHIEINYDLIREEEGPGITEKTTAFYRYYRPKVAQ